MGGDSATILLGIAAAAAGPGLCVASGDSTAAGLITPGILDLAGVGGSPHARKIGLVSGCLWAGHQLLGWHSDQAEPSLP